MTIKSTLATIRALGDLRATCADGEYRVTVACLSIQQRHPEVSRMVAIERAEAIAYYTNDADDALCTGAVIAAHFALHGAL
jgi:hypothetical protein